MRILIITSSLFGTASHHLDYLMKSSHIEIGMVVLNEGLVLDRKKQFIKKFKKLLRIGLLGSINGLRIRKWYKKDMNKYLEIGNLEEKCLKVNIPFFRTSTINSEKTRNLFRSANSDLGISLGNGYIPASVFSIPKYGMVNIHHEILPQFQNAQSIIWQIYEGSSNTGYTIHKIDRKIDTGAILLQEIIPIQFRKSLPDTVTFTFVKLLESSAIGLVKILENFNHYFSNAYPQGAGKTYTTPKIGQFIRMLRKFREIKFNKEIQI